MEFASKPIPLADGQKTVQYDSRMNPDFLRKLFASVVIVIGSMMMPAKAADIRSTPHNLTGEKDIRKLDERQVCTFCHTPVVAISEGASQAPGSSPQWQSSLPKDHSFTIYDDIGRLGLGKPSVGSQSIACMSCHDSTQAMGVGKTSSDHPFGVPYRGAMQGRSNSQSLAASPSTAPDDGAPRRAAIHLKSLEDFRPVSQGRVEDRTVWWVSATGPSTRRMRSDLPLYARKDELQGSEVPHIECSSCHDPHTANETFLRVPNEGSKLCLTCHDK